MNMLRWFWKTSRGVRLSVLLSSFIGVLYVGISLAFVYVCKMLMDIATGDVHARMEVYVGLLIGCIVGQISLSAINTRLSVYNDVQLRNNLRYHLFSHLLDTEYIVDRKRRHTGDILNRLIEDVRIVTNAIGQLFPSLLVTSVQFIAAFFFLLSLESRLAIVVVLIMPLCLVISKLFYRKMQQMTLTIRQTDSRVQSYLQESIQHQTLLQTLEQISVTTGFLRSLQGELYGQVMRRNRFSLFSQVLVRLAFSIGYAIAFLWGVNGIASGAITFGTMTAFLQLVGQVQRPLMDMARLVPGFITATASSKRLMELEKEETTTHVPSIKLAGSIGIKIDNLSFTYPDSSHPIFERFSYDFKPGSRTAIVGETGAGKSTLIRLILALLKPEQGHLVIYNQKEQIPISLATRCNLIYVPQGNSLLSGTIRDNLLLGNPQATEADICRVLNVAVADFVYEFPQGLDTPCAELGEGLSEGQAQRIAIARALLRPGSVLLFDEFSSSLDEETEEVLMRNLTNFMPGRTMIFITHRSKVTEFCDQELRIIRKHT